MKLGSNQFKKKLKWSILFLVSHQAYAVNPVQGLYAGVFLGASYTPTINITSISYDPSVVLPSPATLSYKIFGNIGVEAGYRFCNNWRVGGEFFINNNPYHNLKFQGYTIPDKGTSQGLRMQGQVTTLGLMANGYFDIFTPGTENYFVPYVGAGIGYAHVHNTLKFYYNNVLISGNINDNASAPAIQGIAGLSYYIDDFAYFALDYRYFTTKKVAPYNSRDNIQSINISFTGGLDGT